MKNKLKLMCLVLSITTVLSLFIGCKSNKNNDIIILYTSDVHCGIDENIGYAGLKAYKNYCQGITEYTTLVDCGDAVQGDLIGTVSDGEYIIDIMNKVGYDLAILGNHEFDYGIDQLNTLIAKSNAEYIGCNITYTGTATNKLSDVKPYKIIEYGDVSVGFVGVSTPQTIAASTPTHFQENGEYVYGFTAESQEAFYGCIQSSVDECISKGADHVILLTHLGDTEPYAPFSSVNVIENTTGIDAVLDGHEHSVIPCRIEKNKNGENVMLSSTGTKLNNIGRLTISASSGEITTGLISSYDEKDAETQTFISGIKSSYEEELNTIVGTCEVELSLSDENGIRMIRSREMPIGNFCADAYRAIASADIGLVNGGGIRADIKKGDVTYSDVISVHPFGNSLCMIEASGQEILDALEIAAVEAQKEYSKDGSAYGENGSFLHVSGLKYTIDTSIESTVEFDSVGMVTTLGDARRVKNVEVVTDDGSYEPLDPNKTYTVASHNYLLKQSGGGHDFFNDNKILIDESIADYEVLINYLTDFLDGKIDSVYSATEGRITVE